MSGRNNQHNKLAMANNEHIKTCYSNNCWENQYLKKIRFKIIDVGKFKLL